MLISTITGFILGLLFGFLIMSYNKVAGPSSSKMKKIIFRNKDNECCILTPEIINCPNK